MGQARRIESGNFALITLFIWMLIVSFPQSALAHASLVRAQPASNTTVSAPVQIDLWFNELLEDGFNSVVVLPAKEVSSTSDQPLNLARGKPVVDPRDRTHLSVELKTLQPGTYIVRWRVLSRDGHSAPGQFSFKVIGSK